MSRIILKFSGEALKDDTKSVSEDKLKIVKETIEILKSANNKVGVVIGGGNFFRGRENPEMNTLTADTIGMLGTVMNALYLKDYLEKCGIKCIVSTPFVFPKLIDNYTDADLKSKYDKDYVILFGGGVGMSGYSTDSGAVLAMEKVDADLIIKMTNVDGVYDGDPKENPNLKKYDSLTYDYVLKNDLKVMDSYAISKCYERKAKILVINFKNYKDVLKALAGEKIGTIIYE